MEGILPTNHQLPKQRLSPKKSLGNSSHLPNKQNQVGTVMLYGIPIVSLVIESQERLCLAQISNTLLKQYSYNEIHNRRVALGITCVQCTPVQLEILRRAGAMPVSSRRCGMITRREAERLCKSFLGDNAPPRLPDDFAFSVHHECAWGCRGAFLPSRYNSSRAKCIKCTFCGLFFSPNKFIFHSHRTSPNATYVQPDAANFNSWRRHMKLSGSPPDDVVHAWEDVKAMFNGGTRKRLLASSSSSSSGSGALPIRSPLTTSVPMTMASTPTKQIKLDTSTSTNSPYPTPTNTPIPVPTPPRVSPFPDLALPISVMDYVWHNGVNAEGMKHQFPFASYAVPWFGNPKRSVLGLSTLSTVNPQQESLFQHLCPPNNSDKFYHHSAFRPVFPTFTRPDVLISPSVHNAVAKRQINTEELLLPKKKYSRELEKVENPSTEKDYNESEEVVGGTVNENHGSESVDKENEMRKKSGNGDIRNSDCPEPLQSGSPCNSVLKMNFKREFVSEIVKDSEDSPKSVSKARNEAENKDIIDMSRLLSIKSNLLEESVFKFREFSPNLLESISTLKTDDRGVYSGLAVRMYQDISASDTEKDDCGNVEIMGDYAKLRGTQMSEEQCKNGFKTEEDECDDDNNDDDEPVDVETTDDIPLGKTTFKIQDGFEKLEKPVVKITEEIGGLGKEKKNRIWAIARFSLEQQDRDSVSPNSAGVCRTSERGVIYKSRRETEYVKNSSTEHKK